MKCEKIKEKIKDSPRSHRGSEEDIAEILQISPAESAAEIYRIFYERITRNMYGKNTNGSVQNNMKKYEH